MEPQKASNRCQRNLQRVHDFTNTENGEVSGGPEGYARRVMEAMNYSVLAGGKRLRPLFLAETAAMYGARCELAEPFMAALEMIHTYSLVSVMISAH